MTVYTNANIAIFMNTPPEMAGVVGGIFNSALQLGVGVGVPVMASISTSIDKKRIAQGLATPDSGDYHGTAAAYWFVVAALVAWAIGMLAFYRVEDMYRRKGEDVEGGSGAVSSAISIDEKEETKAGALEGLHREDDGLATVERAHVADHPLPPA
jgi:hypothetical protein